MADDYSRIEMENLNEILRDLKKLNEKDIPLAIRQANREAAERVAEQGRAEAPVRSGKLKRTIKAGATNRKGFVRAGTAVNVPYAGPIHFGWFRRHILPNPFLYRALDRRIQEVYAAYQRQIDRVIARFNG